MSQDYYEEDEDDYNIQDSESFVPEVKAFERASIGSAFYQLPEDKNFRKHRKGLSDEDLFLMALEFAYIRYRNLLSFSERTIQNIKAIVYRLKHVKYKNAAALLWGYYVLGNAFVINKERIDEAYRYLNPKSKDKENSIKKEDMIRYARLIVLNS